jgi:hypothetical protein
MEGAASERRRVKKTTKRQQQGLGRKGVRSENLSLDKKKLSHKGQVQPILLLVKVVRRSNKVKLNLRQLLRFIISS